MDLARAIAGLMPAGAVAESGIRTSAGTLLVEGVIHSVDGSTAKFTVHDWDEGRHVFGPARWNAAADSPPLVGAECVVLFAAEGVEVPWIVAWTPGKNVVDEALFWMSC